MPDTIVTMRSKITCNVKAISPDLVSYTLPSETVVYSIEKIAVTYIHYGNGRLEKLNEQRLLVNIKGPEEWEKVDIATTEAETHGLYKVDLISTKATGTTVYSSVTKVQNRAFDKMKMAAALLGGNLVYIKNQSLEGNIRSNSGGRASRAQITGTVYCSDLPDSETLKKNLESRKKIQVVNEVKLGNSDAQLKFLYGLIIGGEIISHDLDKGFVILQLKLNGRLMDVQYRVIRFDNNYITVAYRDGTSIHNLRLRWL
jgi:hypothetical protein